MPKLTKSEAQSIPVTDKLSGRPLGVLTDGNGGVLMLSEQDILDIIENPPPPLDKDEMPF